MWLKVTRGTQLDVAVPICMTPVPLNHEGEGVVCALCCSPAEGPCFSLAGVQSALYGLALSLLIGVAAVAVFTTHVLLLLPVLLSILGKWAGGQERAGISLAVSSFSPPLTVSSLQ